MAKLSSLFSFDGSLDGISVYRMSGVKQPVVRRKGGPSKEQIKTLPSCANTRRNNDEWKGCTTGSSLLMQAFNPLRHLADQATCGRLNGLFCGVQKQDTENVWGRRRIQLSLYPWLIEGFLLTKGNPLEAVVRTPPVCSISKDSVSARVELPELVPGVNLSLYTPYPLYRLTAALGYMPNLAYEEAYGHYRPIGNDPRLFAAAVSTQWQPLKNRTAASVLEPCLQGNPPSSPFSLVLTLGIEYGTIGSGGDIEAVRKAGSARIVMVR